MCACMRACARVHFSVRKRLLWLTINIEFSFCGAEMIFDLIVSNFCWVSFFFLSRLYGCFNIVYCTFDKWQMWILFCWKLLSQKHARQCKMSSIQWGEKVSLVQRCAFVSRWTYHEEKKTNEKNKTFITISCFT